MGAKGDLTRKMLDAFFNEGMDAASTYFSSDVIANVPGRNQVSGRHEGREALLALGKKREELTDGTFKAELNGVTESEEHACALFFVTGVRDGKELSYRQVNVYHFEGDKISELFMYPFEHDLADELFA